MDAMTRQAIAFHTGDRSRENGGQLWAKIPGVYQQQATFYTDVYEVYKDMIRLTQHKVLTE
jgi:IS1 family transposase